MGNNACESDCMNDTNIVFIKYITCWLDNGDADGDGDGEGNA